MKGFRKFFENFQYFETLLILRSLKKHKIKDPHYFGVFHSHMPKEEAE